MDLSSVQHQLHHRFLNHHHHHNQEMDSESLDSIIASSKQQHQSATSAAVQEKLTQISNSTKPRPSDEEAQKCPRCDSTNTKFCYYNNYSLTQPRYFCKSCRRYWTKGGTLRNVPVGGGCRKSNKRPSSPSSLLLKRPHHLTSNSAPPLPFTTGGTFDHHPSLLQNGAALFHNLGYGDELVPEVKQEGGGLWGFPWQLMNYADHHHQINGAATSAANSSSDYGSTWNGLSAWQGFINSPALI